jgi:starch synthase
VALKRLGADVSLALPFYCAVREKGVEHVVLLKDLKVPLGNSELVASVLGSNTGDGVPVYMFEREDMYDRPNLYGTSTGNYYDNLKRFTFFVRATLSTVETLSIKPDLIHCHGWQTGLVPALLEGPYRDNPSFEGVRTVFTIHNLGYQGFFAPENLPLTGLARGEFFHPDGLEYFRKISFLRGGIVYSDAITTLSATYAREIQTPGYGMGMGEILRYRHRSLHGILNGVDYCLWDPSRDTYIAANYSPRKMAGKQACKESLIQEVGLDHLLANRPLLGMISRLNAPKGLDLLVQILDEILALDVGLVVLGSGDELM